MDSWRYDLIACTTGLLDAVCVLAIRGHELCACAHPEMTTVYAHTVYNAHTTLPVQMCSFASTTRTSTGTVVKCRLHLPLNDVLRLYRCDANLKVVTQSCHLIESACHA